MFFKKRYSEMVAEEPESKRGRPVSAKSLSRSKKAKEVSLADKEEVFNYWVDTLKASARRKPVLDEKRLATIGAAIYDFGVEQCKQAIDGCKLSPFHMGRNKMNKKYDDIELILRDAQHIERFLEQLDNSSDEKDPW
jgi:hypothetical protein